MRLPAGRFSKLLDRVRGTVSYDGPDLPRSGAEVVTDLRKRVEEAEAHFQERNSDFVYWRNYILGDEQRNKYTSQFEKMPELANEFVVTNYTRALISHLISLLSSSLGQAFVVATDEARQPAADRLTDYLAALRHRDNHSRQMRQWLEDAAVVGTGWLRAYYDQDKGQVCLTRQDASTVYPEPNATCPEEAEFIAIRHVMNVGYARKLYPKLDLEIAEDAGPPRHADEGRGKQMIVRQVVIWEVYHAFGDKLTIYSGDQILFHGDAPMQGKGYPLFPFTFIPSNDEIRGYSLLRDIEDLQDLINRVTTRMSFWQRFWANPMMWTDDPTADIDMNPGGRWLVKRGLKADAIHPPPLPGELFGLVGQTRESLDTITGIQEVNRGVRPVGVTAGVALDLLRQTSEQRMISPLEDASAVLGKAYTYLLGLILRFYVGGESMPMSVNGNTRIARVAADDLYSIEEEPVAPTGDTTSGTTPASDEAAAGLFGAPEQQQMQPVIRPREYIILMQPPGDLPRSPAAKAELAIQLYQMGAIDDVALLEAVKFEGREEVLQRKAQMMQAMMQGQVAGMQERAAAEQTMAQQQHMQMVQ